MKGVVLAAGEGTRIREVTYGAIPKELLPIGNVPTIRFPIETMRLAGIKDLYVVIAPRTKHNVVDALRSGRAFGVNICYLVQEEYMRKATGIGIAILSTKQWLPKDEDFSVACGDSILCDFSSDSPFNCFQPALRIHKMFKPLATVIVYPSGSDIRRYGIAQVGDLTEKRGVSYGEVKTLIEKPSLNVLEKLKGKGASYIIAGYYIFKGEIFSYIEKTEPDKNNEIQITDSMELAIESGEKIYAVVHGPKERIISEGVAYWDVGAPEVYREANMRLSNLDLNSLMKRRHR